MSIIITKGLGAFSIKIDFVNRYSRDYYINDAKSPTGTRRRQSDFPLLTSSDDDYVSDFDTLVKLRRRARPNSILPAPPAVARRTQSLRLQKKSSHIYGARIRSISTHSDYAGTTAIAEDDKLSQLERHILHNNLRRNSFRSRIGLRNFALNPIYDNDEVDEESRLSKMAADKSVPLGNSNSSSISKMSSLW